MTRTWSVLCARAGGRVDTVGCAPTSAAGELDNCSRRGAVQRAMLQ
jgi:hypothetical protein